jgi:hypothetical protein
MITNKEYNNLLEVPTIPYGSYNVDLDIDWHNSNAQKFLNSDAVKFTGANNVNTFCKFTPDLKAEFSEYLNKKIGMSFDWTMEYFQSSEPAGLHTDYESFENSWKPKEMEVITHDCHLLVGVIIPLEWNCKQPYTVNYNRISDIPRKLIYRKGEMRYKDNNEVFTYRDAWDYDPEVLKYNPEGTEYFREYADLKVHSVYKWNLETMMVFDTRRWHSSSWFLSTDTVKIPPTEYKRSIIAFGSIDIIREEFR